MAAFKGGKGNLIMGNVVNDGPATYGLQNLGYTSINNVRTEQLAAFKGGAGDLRIGSVVNDGPATYGLLLIWDYQFTHNVKNWKD